jgi:hypothetical protein
MFAKSEVQEILSSGSIADCFGHVLPENCVLVLLMETSYYLSVLWAVWGLQI